MSSLISTDVIMPKSDLVGIVDVVTSELGMIKNQVTSMNRNNSCIPNQIEKLKAHAGFLDGVVYEQKTTLIPALQTQTQNLQIDTATNKQHIGSIENRITNLEAAQNGLLDKLMVFEQSLNSRIETIRRDFVPREEFQSQVLNGEKISALMEKLFDTKLQNLNWKFETYDKEVERLNTMTRTNSNTSRSNSVRLGSIRAKVENLQSTSENPHASNRVPSPKRADQKTNNFCFFDPFK